MKKIKGLLQGAPESSKIVAAILAEMLLRLLRTWRKEGRGILLGRFVGSKEAFKAWAQLLFDHLWYYEPEDIHVASLGFLDDIITLSYSMSDANHMFADIWNELRKLSMQPQPRKLKVMCNKYVLDSDTELSCIAGKLSVLKALRSWALLSLLMPPNMEPIRI